MSTNKPNVIPQTQKETQQDSFFRYYLRLNRVFVLTIFVIAATLVAFSPTAPRLAGLAIVAALTGVSLLAGRVSLRTFGFAILACAGLTAVIAGFARPHWLMKPDELAKMAITIAATGLLLICTNKKTGEANARLENGAGVLCLLGILSVTGVIISCGAASVERPAGILVLEGLAALAEMASKKWKLRLSFAALLPMVGILADYLQPEWRRISRHGFNCFFAFLSAHTHSWMIWPILFGGMNSVMTCINNRRGWRATLVKLFLIVLGIWIFLLVMDAIL